VNTGQPGISLLQAENANKSASRITSGSICKVRGAYRDPSRVEPSPDVILSALEPPFVIAMISDASSHAETSTGHFNNDLRVLSLPSRCFCLRNLASRKKLAPRSCIAVSGRIGSACNDEIILWLYKLSAS